MINIVLQVGDSILGFPTGFDVIASILEDWWHAYKAVQALKIV